MEKDENGKPLIRHCKNCKWYNRGCVTKCDVRYTDIDFPRLKAKFCKFYEVTTKPYWRR